MQNNKRTVRKRFTFWDCVLIVLLFCVATACVLPSVMRVDEALTVVARKDSAVVYTKKLSEVKDSFLVCIDEEYNVMLCVYPDGVEVTASDCGDKVCVNTGKITKAGQSVVCLPAHVSVELSVGNSADNASELDAVVG